MGFWRAGLCSWYKFPGQLRTITGLEVPGHGRSGPQKSQPEQSLVCSDTRNVYYSVYGYIRIFKFWLTG